MLNLFRKKRIERLVDNAAAYVRLNYKAASQRSEMRFSIDDSDETPQAHTPEPDSGIRYSKKPQRLPAEEDQFNAFEVTRILRSSSAERSVRDTLSTLERNVNRTFVDKLLQLINERGLRDSEVYKAAHVDKRLFSKMVSNREYKPAKDTAIALALALKLPLEEANDLLSRAGYTFSHSNKRDVIIEFFFREKVYNLMDANDVLYRLNQKLIGRE